MKTFQWGRHFETGLDTVDEQRRTLVSLIRFDIFRYWRARSILPSPCCPDELTD